MKINWKVRFTKDNINFIIRFISALLIPALASIGIDWQNLTSWYVLGDAFVQIISNPVVLALMLYNGLNMIPDSTSKGLSDSNLALSYEKPNNRK